MSAGRVAESECTRHGRKVEITDGSVASPVARAERCGGPARRLRPGLGRLRRRAAALLGRRKSHVGDSESWEWHRISSRFYGENFGLDAGSRLAPAKPWRSSRGRPHQRRRGLVMAAASSKSAFVRSNGPAGNGCTQVLVVNLGTPRAPTPQAVREFLAEFLSDPMVVDYPAWLWRPILDNIILNVRPERVAGWYASIAQDGRMPLAAGTEAIAEALQEALGSRARVRVAYRYGSPAVGAEVVEAARHAQQVVVLPLFPQTTASSLGTILVEARRAAAEAGLAHKLRFAVIAPDDPGYIGACAARVRAAIAGRPAQHLVVSFHSLPRRHDRRERGRYRKECEKTANALVEALDWPRANMTLAYQSRFGPEPWIGPATAGVLRRLPAKGIRDIVVVTPGFVTDGLETLDEIGVRGRELFLGAGGTSLTCVPAVAAHEAFIESLRALVLGRISAADDLRGEAYAS